MKLVQNHGSAIKKEVDLKPEEDQQKTSYCYECFFAKKQSHCAHYAVIILFMFQIQKSTLTNTLFYLCEILIHEK